MKAMSLVVASMLLAACQSLPRPPAAPFTAVPGFAAAVAVPGASEVPDARSDLRAVFPATRAAGTPDRPLPTLERAARYLNVLGAQGLRIRPGDVVVVVSGPATTAVLGDEAYAARHRNAGVAGNPNLPLVRALLDAGAVVSVCGQALHGQGIPAEAVAPGVRVDLSATTTLVRLQSLGYALVPE